MIRSLKKKDTEQVLDIWLKSSIIAHHFITRTFWESKIPDMREIYLPDSETYVYEDSEGIKGFISLSGNTIAAIFVLPDKQGFGVGQKLMDKAKQVRNTLDLMVYKENIKTIKFYEKCDFKTTKEQVDGETGCPELMMRFN